MTDQIHVRVGTPEDLDQVMALAQMMHAEIGITSLEPQRVLPEIWAALNLDRGIMGVIGAPGAPIEGAILLRYGKLFYSDEDILEERGLFVHPEFRAAKGGRAKLLCEFAKTASDQLGLKLLIGVMNAQGAEGKIRLYERQFGAPCGVFFLHTPGVH